MINSRLGLFTAACFRRHPFSRSYGVILPSSLTTLLPPALGSSPHPPVSDCGTGMMYAIAAFLGTWLMDFPTLIRYASRLCFIWRICLPNSSYACPGIPFPAYALLLCPHISVIRQYRNLHLLSIGYAFLPRLRPRLTQGRSALPWKP